VRALGQAVMDSITGEQTTKLLDLERALNSLNGRRQRAGNSVEPTALAVFAVTDLYIVAGVLFDLASRKRVHPAYVWGGLLIISSQLGRLALWHTAGWLAIARMLAA